MSFLPIVSCYLHTASRRRATYWLRFLAAAAALVLGSGIYFDDMQRPTAFIAKDILTALLFVCLVYGMALGLGATVDCISIEKREGTLGLLFLTDLKGLDIVLGKFVAASVTGFYGLLATAPILALTLLLGGVSAGQVGRNFLLVGDAFLFQMAAGIFVSVLSRKQMRSMFAALALLILFNLVLPLIGALLLFFIPSHRSGLAEALFLPSPILNLIVAIDPAPFPQVNHFWAALAVIHALTWLFLILASFIVPYCWQDRPAEGWRTRWRLFWQECSYGRPQKRIRLRAYLLSLNPVCWLSGRLRNRPACVWAFLLAVAAFSLWGGAHFGAEWFHQGIYFPTALFINGILKVWVAAETGRQLFEDRRAGSLELLLTTPLAVKEILRGQFLALRRQFLGPVLVALAVQFIFMAASLQGDPRPAVTPLLWILVMLIFVADLAAIAWTGTWAALTVKPPNHPPAATWIRLLAAPWFVTYLIGGVLQFVLAPVELTWMFLVGLWVTISLLFDLAYGVSAWWQLRTNFRRLAAEPSTPFRSQLAGWLSLARFRRTTRV